ncbi:MAG: 23S rRNA (uracil(1939)-C(5))-methyltransferase RlmD [Vagococcus sp.]
MKKEKYECPVAKNDRVKVVIEDLTHDGRGVGKVDHYPLFIENAIPGEEVQVQVMKTTKKFGYAKVIRWIEKSEDRVEEVETNWIRTGIAPIHHMTYSAQLTFKQNQVKNAMKKIGHFEDMDVKSVLGMEQPFAYRNKAQIPVRKIDNQLEFGFFRRNSHDLVPIEDFYIQEPEIDELLINLKEILIKYGVKPYNESDDTGNLKNVMVRKGHYTGQLMIVFVTKKKKVFKVDQITAEIVEQNPNVVSIMQNIHPEKTNTILGKEFMCLYGKEYIEDQLLGKTYHVSAKSFYQINTKQAEVLYKEAIQLADFKETDIVVDAYCGIGTIALSIAEKVKKVYGVEVVEDAILDAKENASLNGIDNAEFEVGRAEYVFKKWLEDGFKPNVVIVDPPRKGLDAQFIDACCDMDPEKVIYVSCDPATLARDMKLFAEKGYTTNSVQPVDMFPQTSHVESVVLLEK